jgi:ElaB/YqjD/DUF883 family membrane-anchored ribosome-binding protein
MKQQQNSERSTEHSRVPLIVVEGRRMLRRSARKAGDVATRVARKSRRMVGQTVQRTERLARRNPWTGLGAAMCAGMGVGALLTWLVIRD